MSVSGTWKRSAVNITWRRKGWMDKRKKDQNMGQWDLSCFLTPWVNQHASKEFQLCSFGSFSLSHRLDQTEQIQLWPPIPSRWNCTNVATWGTMSPPSANPLQLISKEACCRFEMVLNQSFCSTKLSDALLTLLKRTYMHDSAWCLVLWHSVIHNVPCTSW